MYRGLICLLALLGSASNLFGQSAPYNPYAPQEEFVEPKAADGKLNWPSFFKSAGMEAKYQRYFRMGACVGTKATTNAMLRDNKVDVNALPETTTQGAAVRMQFGMIQLRDAAGKPVQVVTHPAGVTAIQVSGPMSPRRLCTGMAIRLLGNVDQHGVGSTPIHEVEALTLNKETAIPAVEPNQPQMIVGRITRLASGNQVSLQVPSGTIHRVTLTLADDAVVRVDGSSLDLIAAGDQVVATGHSYSGAGVSAPTVFASKIVVTKAPLAP